MFRCTLKVVVQVTLWHLLFSFLCTATISTRSKRQSTGYGSTWLERKSLSLHHLIILLKLPTNWICFCLQGFLAEKTRKSQSYLANGAMKVLVQEVQPVLSWCSHVLNLFTMLPITNQYQFSENWLCILYPCLTSVIRSEAVFSSTGTYFSANHSFRLVKTSFFVYWKKCFFILLMENITEIWGKSNFKDELYSR